MSNVITLPNNWAPRHYQEAAWRAMEEGVRRFCLVWHRRAGKDDFALHASAVMMHQRPATYWHMLPKSEQARKAVWDAVNPHTGIRRIDEAFPRELREATRENEMSIRFKNGSMWHVVGSDNYDNLVGSPPAGVVFSEWPLANPSAWGYLRPILAENDGWAMFIYTPRGPNHGLRTYQNALTSPGWFAQALTADDTGVFTKHQLELEHQEMVNDYGQEMGDALFQQEYYVSFDAAVLGAIFGKEMSRAREEGRITHVSHDPYLPVGTMWDLGYSDDTAIWFFQIAGDQIRFIDFFSASNESLEFYAGVLKDKAERHKYHYDRTMMLFPHDINVHELSSGKTRKRILQELGVPVRALDKGPDVWDTIAATRREFHRFWFDVDRCEKGITDLTLYKRKYDPKTRTFSSKPDHGEESHAADALRTGIFMLPRHMSTKRLVSGRDKYRKALEETPAPPTPWCA